VLILEILLWLGAGLLLAGFKINRLHGPIPPGARLRMLVVGASGALAGGAIGRPNLTGGPPFGGHIITTLVAAIVVSLFALNLFGPRSTGTPDR